MFYKKERIQRQDSKTIIFDVETDQSSKTHKVNFIHVIYYRQSRAE